MSDCVNSENTRKQRKFSIDRSGTFVTVFAAFLIVLASVLVIINNISQDSKCHETDLNRYHRAEAYLIDSVCSILNPPSLMDTDLMTHAKEDYKFRWNGYLTLTDVSNIFGLVTMTLSIILITMEMAVRWYMRHRYNAVFAAVEEILAFDNPNTIRASSMVSKLSWNVHRTLGRNTKACLVFFISAGFRILLSCFLMYICIHMRQFKQFSFLPRFDGLRKCTIEVTFPYFTDEFDIFCPDWIQPVVLCTFLVIHVTSISGSLISSFYFFLKLGKCYLLKFGTEYISYSFGAAPQGSNYLLTVADQIHIFDTLIVHAVLTSLPIDQRCNFLCFLAEENGLGFPLQIQNEFNMALRNRRNPGHHETTFFIGEDDPAEEE